MSGRQAGQWHSCCLKASPSGDLLVAPVCSAISGLWSERGLGPPRCFTASHLSVWMVPPFLDVRVQSAPRKTFFLFINFPCAGRPISSTDLFVPQFVFRYCFCPIDSGFCSGTLIIQMLDVRSPPPIPRVLSLLLRVKSLLHFASSRSGGLCGVSLMSQSERPEGPLVASLAPKPDILPYHTEPPLPLCLSLTSSLHLCFLGASSISSFQ